MSIPVASTFNATDPTQCSAHMISHMALPLRVPVMMPPPYAAVLVAALGRTIEPRIHAPQRIDAARVGGIRVIDDAILERECTHTGPLPDERAHVDARLYRVLMLDRLPGRRHRLLALIVVLDALRLLFLGKRGGVVSVEIAGG